jgi:hypothetical protein
VLDETFPILEEWEKGEAGSSRKRIKEIQGLIKPDAMDLVQGVVALQEGVINAADVLSDAVFKWTPLYWLVKYAMYIIQYLNVLYFAPRGRF